MNDNRGFTLLELVLVISIIGILSVMILPKFERYQESAKIATHNGNVNIIKAAAQMYLLDNPEFKDGDIKEDEVLKYIEDENTLNVDPRIVEISETKETKYKALVKEGKITIEPGKISRGDIKNKGGEKNVEDDV